MEKKIECGIVYDLLPNYIEHLTNEHSNTFVKNHLATCDECKNLYNNLINEMSVNSSTTDEINFLKKYKIHFDILKIILIFILIIVSILFINTTRKVIIINNLQNKASEYINSTNYYIRRVSTEDGFETVVETYKKDQITLQKITKTSYEGTSTMINYSKNGITNTYIEDTNKSKIAILNVENASMSNSIDNWVSTQGLRHTISSSLMCSIKSEKINGIDCYKITNFYPSQSLMSDFENPSFYINKETGLMIKNNDYGSSYFEYTFDVVTDQDLIEPDINEYTIQENN